jgi:putative ABC transport system substrate-binding protein
MRRREFIAGFGAAACPIAAPAQETGRVARIVLWLGAAPSDPEVQRYVAAFRETIRGLGWDDGCNLRVDVRWYAPSFTVEELRTVAVELAALGPDVIVTTGAPILRALHRETKVIPIVFTQVTDPVGDGFVANLARPGGNITGFTIFEHSFAGKWLEMLKEVVPSITRVAVMQNTGHPAWDAYLRVIGAIAARMGVEVTPAPVLDPPEIEASLSTFARSPNGGLILLPSPLVTRHRQVIANAALRNHLPSIYNARMYAVSGGLMSYGHVTREPYRQAAIYVDRILRGTKPGELPVQAASKFEMVFNLKTAKASPGPKGRGLRRRRECRDRIPLGENHVDRVPAMTAELVRRQVAVIVATGGLSAPLAAKAATATIPILFVAPDDPVKLGLVASLSRPGGNVTGVNFLGAELGGKRLELLRELVPAAARVAVLFNPTNLATDAQIGDVQTAARAMGLQLQIYSATTSREIDAALAAMVRERPDALFFIPDPVFNARRVHLVHLASRHALPAIYWQREFAEAGGLISYGSSIGESFRHANAVTARSISPASRMSTGLTSTWCDGAAAWITANWPIPSGIAGSRSTTARVTRGAISLSSSSHFAPVPAPTR